MWPTQFMLKALTWMWRLACVMGRVLQSVASVLQPGQAVELLVVQVEGVDGLAHHVGVFVDVQEAGNARVGRAVAAGHELDGPGVVLVAGVGQALAGIEGLGGDDEIRKTLGQVHVGRGARQLRSFDLHELQLPGDRKSTRLNSSHLVISYAVFCLKKKKINIPFCLLPTRTMLRRSSLV